jgi:gamma-glutamyltranspeptidase
VILNYIALGMDILSAVRHPRIHSQLLPDVVDLEEVTLVSGKYLISVLVSSKKSAC